MQQEKTLDMLKTEAEISKIMAEAAKISTEARWYPFVVSSGLVVAIITLTKLFL